MALLSDQYPQSRCADSGPSVFRERLADLDRAAARRFRGRSGSEMA